MLSLSSLCFRTQNNSTLYFSPPVNLLEILAFRVAVDDILVRWKKSFGTAIGTGLGLHQSGTEESQIVGLFDRTAVDGRTVDETGDLVDLFSGAESATDSGCCSRSNVFLAFDVIQSVDRIRVRQTDRVALGVEFVQIDAATPEALTQITWRKNPRNSTIH